MLIVHVSQSGYLDKVECSEYMNVSLMSPQLKFLHSLKQNYTFKFKKVQ